MRISAKLRFAYELHMDTPVKLRFAHDCEHYYNLEFCLLDGSKEAWHVVQQYHHPLRGDKPGVDADISIYGNWTNRWFEVESPEDARCQLEKFKASYKTAGDIYRRFIEPDVRAREADMEAYENEKKRERELPACIE